MSHQLDFNRHKMIEYQFGVVADEKLNLFRDLGLTYYLEKHDDLYNKLILFFKKMGFDKIEIEQVLWHDDDSFFIFLIGSSSNKNYEVEVNYNRSFMFQTAEIFLRKKDDTIEHIKRIERSN